MFESGVQIEMSVNRFIMVITSNCLSQLVGRNFIAIFETERMLGIYFVKQNSFISLIYFARHDGRVSLVLRKVKQVFWRKTFGL